MGNELRLSIFFLLLSTTSVFATNWYVRPLGGSYGSHNGTNYENAWNGFSEINFVGMASSDTLIICGKHTEALFLDKNGTTSSQFTLTGACPSDAGSIFVIGNNALRWISDGQYIDVVDISLYSNASNVVFLGIGSDTKQPVPKTRFYNVNMSGASDVCLRYASTYGVISGGTYTGCKGGAIHTWNSQDVIVEKIKSFDNGTSGATNTDDIGIDDGSSGSVVRNNIIGYSKCSDGSAIDMQDSTASDKVALVYDNYIYSGNGHGVTLGGTVSTIAYNNKSEGNVESNFNSHLTPTGKAYFYNNTSLGATAVDLKVGYTSDGIQNVTAINNNFAVGSIKVFLNNLADTFINSNNIFGVSPQFQSYNSPTTTTYSWTEWATVGFGGNNNVVKDPLNMSDGSLYPNSPAINAGISIPEVTTDYYGNPRIGNDIGAVTYGRTSYKGLTISGATTIR